MTEASIPPFRQSLRKLMAQVGISSIEELARRSQVSTWQIYRIEWGLISRLSLENAVKLANTLQVSISALLTDLCPNDLILNVPAGVELSSRDSTGEVGRIEQEYRRLEREMAEQRLRLIAEFQQATLEALETLLLQWPTAAAMARKNPQLPAVNLLALVRPVSELLKGWGVEAIGAVGEGVPYDPQCHQLTEGQAGKGDRVWVRYVGYRQGDRLLYRAKVSPFAPSLDTRSGQDAGNAASERPVLHRPIFPASPPPVRSGDSSDLPSEDTASTNGLAETDGDQLPPTISDSLPVEGMEVEGEIGVDDFSELEMEGVPPPDGGELFQEDFMDDYPDSRGTRVYFYE